MQYLLAIYGDEKAYDALPQDVLEQSYGAWMAYTQALHDAKVFVAGERLESTTAATTVRVGADGKTAVLDGPYADTKEQLGGYYLIEVPDVDAAISWAARCPGAAYGTIEVRPIYAMAPSTV